MQSPRDPLQGSQPQQPAPQQPHPQPQQSPTYQNNPPKLTWASKYGKGAAGSATAATAATTATTTGWLNKGNTWIQQSPTTEKNKWQGQNNWTKKPEQKPNMDLSAWGRHRLGEATKEDEEKLLRQKNGQEGEAEEEECFVKQEVEDSNADGKGMASDGSKFQQDDLDNDLNIRFEPSNYRPNQKKSSKAINIRQDLGFQQQRAIKRMIKTYWQTIKNHKVTSIDNLKALIFLPYPSIKLQYTLNSQQDGYTDLIAFFRKDQQKDKFIHEIFKRLFNQNFIQIRGDVYRKMFRVVQYRAQMLKKMYKASLGEGWNCMVKSSVAVYGLVNRETLHFCFVDFNYNEISFNSWFVESVKDMFPEAHSFCEKQLKKLQSAQQSNTDNPLLLDYQLSSDQQQPPFQPTFNLQHSKQQLQSYFQQDITSDFQAKIELKNNKFNELMQRNENRQEMLKLGDEVFELQCMLDSYKESRSEVRGEYVHLKVAGRMDKGEEVARKIQVLCKEMRMMRNQLLSQLPIIARKRELFRCLDQADLVILEGETGSGKSTQLPQMLCEYYKILRDPKAKPIVLTQPRKLATRTLAQRIAFQMGEDIGGLITYAASSCKTVKKHSKIIVKLDRLLLDQIQSDRLLSNYSCLIIDQAHQRTISIDVIIGLIKTILSNRKNFKVIITSATLDSALFQHYFKVKTFKVSGRLYPVQTIHKPYPEYQQNLFTDKIYKCIREEILENRATMKEKFRGHVLAFCTTVAEIDQLCERVANYVDGSSFLVCPLHGKLLPEEQRKAFSESEGKFKFIFATRIAETAVTIDKVKVVIDIGYDRETVYDQKKKISSFDVMPISVSAAKQRAGRAGRTSAGYCFRLYNQEFEKKSMKANKTPEIESTPLDIVVLRLKQLQIKDLVNFPYLSKPKEQNLLHSVETMQLIGCLDQKYEITEIGRALVKIPIQPLLSRAIVDALIMDRLDKTRIITPKIIKILSLIVNSQSIFYSDENTREICQKSKFRDFADQDGDFFSLLNVYEAFDEAIMKKKSVHIFCKQRFLNKKSLNQARDLVKEITQIIQQTPLNLTKFQGYIDWMSKKLKHFTTQKQIIISCLLSSFCQNLCLFSGQSLIGYTLIASRIPLKIYGSSFLSLQGINPKWIVCYDIIHTSSTFCRVAQAVDFNMLRSSLTQQVYRKYKLDQCEKFNPFYKVLQFDLPSVILKDFVQRKFNKDERVADFIKDCECIYNSDTNTLKVFHLGDDSLQLKIKGYLHLVQTQCTKPYHHNFLGTITATLGPGCQVLKIHLSRDLFSVKIHDLSVQHQQCLHLIYSPFCYSMDFQLHSVTLTFQSEEERRVFVQWFREEFGGRMGVKASLEIVTEKKMKDGKLAKGCLKVRFWASETRKQSKLLILYQKPPGYRPPDSDTPPQNSPYNPNSPYQFKSFIRNVQYAATYFQVNCRRQLTFKTARNLSSINVYLDCSTISNQYELEQLLSTLYDRNPSLLKHSRIIGFRQIDTDYSSKTEEYWEKELHRLMPGVSLDGITVRGTNQDQAQKDVRGFFTDLVGVVSVVESREAEEFVGKYNGKKGVLGTEKMHATLTYKQNIMRVPVKIYNIFKNRYQLQKEYLEKSVPGLEISQNQWKGKQGQDYIFLNCCHSKRDKLLLPTEQLRSIFTKFTIKVQPPVIKILTRNSSRGGKAYHDLFESLSCLFDYHIYCEILAKKCQIAIYCSSSIFKEVERTLQEYLSQYSNIEVKVSYKGKNVYKVQEVLKRFQGSVRSAISYSERAVYIQGKAEAAGECENEINKLVDSEKKECEICFYALSLPIKLFNCKHSFCNSCIVNYIRGINEQPNNFPIKCLLEGCGKGISICDFRMLLDYEQFDRMCDKGVLKLVDQIKYHGCFTVNCQQIFEVQRTKSDNNVFSCGVCNLSYCYLCKQNDHSPHTCEQMKQNRQGLTDEQMNKMGIKKCPQCKSGIQKNLGCNHISCRCGAHVCWKCLKGFSGKRECEDHLARECGGIF